MAAMIVLPGDDLDPRAFLPPQDEQASSKPAKPLRIGPGLRKLLPNGEVVSTVPGQVIFDKKKNFVWVEGETGRYTPATGDLVVGQVLHAGSDQAIVALAPHDAPQLRAVLPVLAFAGATRKNRPDLNAGSLVYARVALAGKHMDTELECADMNTGKADGLGLLTGGMVFNISGGMSRRLMMKTSKNKNANGLVLFEALTQEGLVFETAVGRNGRLWVGSEEQRTVLVVGRAVTATDSGHLDEQAQRALVRKLVRGGS